MLKISKTQPFAALKNHQYVMLCLVWTGLASSGCVTKTSAEYGTTVVRPKDTSSFVSECKSFRVLPLARIFNGVQPKTCSGAFIAPNLFLTAAHCLVGQNRLEIPRSLRSPLVSTTWSYPSGFDPQKVAIHQSVAFDVGLVDFSDKSGKVYFKDHILPLNKEMVRKGQQIAFAGYGWSTRQQCDDMASGKRNAYNARLGTGVNFVRSFGIADSPTSIISCGSFQQGVIQEDQFLPRIPKVNAALLVLCRVGITNSQFLPI